MENNWILPCNINIFDINTHFSASQELYWGATASTKTGDILFVYIGRPFSEIRYRCRVVETDVPENVIKASQVYFLTEKKRKRNYIRIKLEKSYPEHFFPYYELIDNGLVSVQSQMRITNELEQYIKEKENHLGEKGETNA